MQSLEPKKKPGFGKTFTVQKAASLDYKEGDRVKHAKFGEGTVKEIQIFYTKLTTIDNKTIVIPNGILTNNSLTNATAKDERRLDLKVDISYDADLKKAKAMIMDVLNDDPAVLREDEIVVFVDELGESSVVLGARAWTKSADFWQAKWRILENIKEKMDENQIEIPYRQLTVHMNKNA